MLLLSCDGICCRHVGVILRELGVVGLALESLDGIADPHVDDVIRGQSPHDELPRRGGDARDARLARRVERDAIAANVPQFRVRVFGEVNRLLFLFLFFKNIRFHPEQKRHGVAPVYVYKL